MSRIHTIRYDGEFLYFNSIHSTVRSITEVIAPLPHRGSYRRGYIDFIISDIPVSHDVLESLMSLQGDSATIIANQYYGRDEAYIMVNSERSIPFIEWARIKYNNYLYLRTKND